MKTKGFCPVHLYERSYTSWQWLKRDLLSSIAGSLYHVALDRTGVAYFVSTSCVCHRLTRSSSERQLQLLCSVYGVIQQGDVPMSSMLQAMMERVLLPLASHCCTKALSDFYVANVSDITALLLSRFTKVCFLTLLRLGKYLKMQTLIAFVALWFYFRILW